MYPRPDGRRPNWVHFSRISSFVESTQNSTMASRKDDPISPTRRQITAPPHPTRCTCCNPRVSNSTCFLNRGRSNAQRCRVMSSPTPPGLPSECPLRPPPPYGYLTTLHRSPSSIHHHYPARPPAPAPPFRPPHPSLLITLEGIPWQIQHEIFVL